MRSLSFLYRSFLGTVAATAFFVAGAVHAQSTVVPNEDWEMGDGSFLTVESSIGIGGVCDADGWGTSDATSETGTVEDLGVSPGDFVCFFVSISGLPYDLTYDTSASTVTIHDAAASTSVGDCAGDVTGDWTADSGSTSSAGSGVMVFDEQVWDDPNDNNDPCLLSGEIYIEWPR